MRRSALLFGTAMAVLGCAPRPTLRFCPPLRDHAAEELRLQRVSLAIEQRAWIGLTKREMADVLVALGFPRPRRRDYRKPYEEFFGKDRYDECLLYPFYSSQHALCILYRNGEVAGAMIDYQE